MSAITLPDFKYVKQCARGREERLLFIISEVKKNPDFNFNSPDQSNILSIDDTIQYCLRMMHSGPQTRRDITEQIQMELKII